ncbi:MAG: Trk system potassium transporter TrkA, partial [Alphaproteobacteria bacterium]|nr:Trk system potassium transporter TrkA [Alphaproteobacteria bacterium]
MKVVICGAGQVGTSIARYLATEGNSVTVIDQSAELIQRLSDMLDVRGLVGHASHPGVLAEAGAADADMLIAVTYADEVNMIACEVAHALFDVPTKIARIRAQAYLQPAWRKLFARDRLPIDVVISPEIEVAHAITRRLDVPGAFDVLSLAGGLVRVVGVRCVAGCPVVNTPLGQIGGLFPNLDIVIVGLVRDGKSVVPEADETIRAGDEVYFVADARHVQRAMLAFGHGEPQGRRVVIVGGGNIGLYLSQEIHESHPEVAVTVIELDKQRAADICQRAGHVVVLNGDGLDNEILDEANVRTAETFIAVTDDDEVNVLSSILAKRLGAQRVVTLINKPSYEPLVTNLGIDVVVNPRTITVSNILQHVRRGRIRAVHSLREGFGEIIEAEAMETSVLVGRPLREVDLPKGIVIGAIVRGRTVIIPNGSVVVKAEDRIVLMAAPGAVRKVEKMFAVRL